jgi:hypothetical protein
MKVLQSGFNMNWFEFKFTSSLSVEDNLNNEVKLFPNPVSYSFSLKLSQHQRIKSVKIVDMNGRLVKNIQPDITTNSVYNLSNLKSGIYFVLIETDQGIAQKKLIKN